MMISTLGTRMPLTGEAERTEPGGAAPGSDAAAKSSGRRGGQTAARKAHDAAGPRERRQPGRV